MRREIEPKIAKNYFWTWTLVVFFRVLSDFPADLLRFHQVTNPTFALFFKILPRMSTRGESKGTRQQWSGSEATAGTRWRDRCLNGCYRKPTPNWQGEIEEGSEQREEWRTWCLAFYTPQQNNERRAEGLADAVVNHKRFQSLSNGRSNTNYGDETKSVNAKLPGEE